MNDSWNKLSLYLFFKIYFTMIHKLNFELFCKSYHLLLRIYSSSEYMYPSLGTEDGALLLCSPYSLLKQFAFGFVLLLWFLLSRPK